MEKELKNLVKGEKIKIKWGFSVHEAIVIGNSPKDKRIFLEVYSRRGQIITQSILNYDEYNFEDFNALNNSPDPQVCPHCGQPVVPR